MPNQRDFYAANAIRTSQDIERLSQRRDLDVWTRIKLAAGGYVDDFLKGKARDWYLQLAHNANATNLFGKEVTKTFQMLAEQMFADLTDFIDVTPWKDLPMPFFLIEFYFELESPVITRDETSHYPIENPIRKDYALKLPMLGSTGWKGLLRNAFLFVHLFPNWNEFYKKKDEASRKKYLQTRWQMLRLFGAEKEATKEQRLHQALMEDAGGFKKFAISRFAKEGQKPPKEIPNTAGCIYTYPTIFSNLEVELINPHDSVRRVGTQPIHLEIIPSGSMGLFRIFYLLNRPTLSTSEDMNIDAKRDLVVMLKTIQFLFLELGISAKRTSGHGQVKTEMVKNKGRIVDNFLMPFLADGTRQVQEKKISNLSEIENVTKGGGTDYE